MIMSGDPLSRPLIEIARELRDRRATARELVDAAIARHESVGERLHAYSFWAPEQARAVAAAADAAFSAGVTAGPLHGLPVSIKDLFAALGIPVSPGRAAGCHLILGSRTGRWWRSCAASSASSRAKPIWSSLRSAAPGRTVTGARPIILGTRRPTARRAVRRVAPASVSWKARRCSPLGATRRARCGFRRAWP